MVALNVIEIRSTQHRLSLFSGLPFFESKRIRWRSANFRGHHTSCARLAVQVGRRELIPWLDARPSAPGPCPSPAPPLLAGAWSFRLV